MDASVDTVLRHPQEIVFAACTDIENWRHWVSGVSRVEMHSPVPIGEQAEFTLYQSIFGQTHAVRYQITELVPLQQFAARSIASGLQFDGGMRLEDHPDGTLVTNWMRATPKSKPGGVFDKLAVVLKGTMNQRMVQELRQLDKYLSRSAIPAA